MALTEAQHRRRFYAAAYYPDSAAAAAAVTDGVDTAAAAAAVTDGVDTAAAAMAAGVDTTPMSPGLHSDEAAPAPMSPGLHYSAAEVTYGGMPALAPHSQPNLRDGGLSPHWGGDRQGGDEFGSGGSGRGNPRQRFPFRGRGGRDRNTRGGRRGFHLPALSSKPAQDVELSQEPAALKEADPAEVQQATTLAEVQKAAPATMATPDRQYPFWCDICRVSCGGLVTLEAHMNGKRHQKTKLRLEQFEAHQKLVAGVQEPMPQMALGEANIDARVSIPSLPEELPKEATSKEVPPEKLIVETNNGSMGIKRKKPSEPVRPAGVCTLCNVVCETITNFNSHLGGKKHMARIKRQKGPDMELPKEATSKEVPPEKLIVETNNGSKDIKQKKPSEPVRPVVCTLCNAVCDTISTFKAHLGGKKHMARIKRLKGPDMEYGCVPGPISSDLPAAGTTEAAETIFFGLARREMLLQQGNEYDGMVTEISLHQQAVESVQAKDELPEPQAKPQVECEEYEDPTTSVGGI